MKRNLIYVFLYFGILIPSLVHSAPERGYKPGELQLITRLTTWILCKNHYRPTELDQKFSRTFFNEYLDTLDPMRIYFTAEDVKKFAIYQNKLGSSLLRGETDFGFELYSLYRKRLSEFIAFAEAECRKPQDFTADEYWSLKRDKSPRPATKEEQKNLWRLKIKNDLLYLRLVDRAMAEDKNKNKDKKQEAAAAAWKWGAVTPEKNLLRRLRDISNEVMKKDQIDILGIYLNSVAQVFGPHTNYFAPKLSEDFDISMSLSLTGIGATLTTDNGFIKVVNIVPGGPAAKDGNLKVEDRIAVAVQENMETTNLIDMPVSKAVRYIRGPEKSRLYLGIMTDKKGNSPVSLNMISNALHYLSVITGIRDYSGIFPEWRGNIYFRVYPLLREKVELVDSGAKGEIKEVRLKNGIIRKIGVLELPSFYHDFEALRRGDKNAKRCSMDVARILMDFKKKKVDCVLMDLRFNGGGSLIEAIEMTGLFIPTGPVVQVRSSNKRTRVEYDEDAKVVYSGPLVILTSKLSASASEIFAAALKDCSRAILVGDSRTFGTVDERLVDGEIISLGESEITVISTPGHTPGGICLYSAPDKLMITGDTLFGGGGIGRTDFKYGSIETLRASLRRILALDGETVILPGHGGASKIAYEQRSLFY